MTLMNFADYLHQTINENGSILCAGIDPRPEEFPHALLKNAEKKATAERGAIYHSLVDFYCRAIEELSKHIACIKPNIAFFEQFGLDALSALGEICRKAREHKLPVILDVKRGDIGSTASAYAEAYFGGKYQSTSSPCFLDVDAVTLSPYMGFDSLDPFLPYCRDHGKGIFLLVKTSNPGAADLQNFRNSEAQPLFQHVAEWLEQRGREFIGNCGFSALGAVVGATFPEEAQMVRRLMPSSYFLIPGFGAQGGSATDAVSGFNSAKEGGIVNASRGIFGELGDKDTDTAFGLMKERVRNFNEQLSGALKHL